MRKGCSVCHRVWDYEPAVDGFCPRCHVPLTRLPDLEGQKITFGPDYHPQPSTAALDLTVVAEEIRKSFSLGFDKAMEFYRCTTQPIPQAVPQQRLVMPEDPEEEEYGPGVLNLNNLSGMSPEAQEAILRSHGLQTWQPPAPEPDPTHEAVSSLIKGEAPLGAEESED